MYDIETKKKMFIKKIATIINFDKGARSTEFSLLWIRKLVSLIFHNIPSYTSGKMILKLYAKIVLNRHHRFCNTILNWSEMWIVKAVCIFSIYVALFTHKITDINIIIYKPHTFFAFFALFSKDIFCFILFQYNKKIWY